MIKYVPILQTHQHIDSMRQEIKILFHFFPFFFGTNLTNMLVNVGYITQTFVIAEDNCQVSLHYHSF